MYFIKRNDKLKEYNDYYKLLELVCNFLDKLNPDYSKAKVIINSNDEKNVAFKNYLIRKGALDIEVFNKIDLNKRFDYDILKEVLLKFKSVLKDLKNYESFQGRIKFSQYSELFNFENYIYEDKQFMYSIVSNYNKKIIPDFISSSFADMIYEDYVSDEIRRNMEQYFIAIMSNMDYNNFAHSSQIKHELSDVLEKENNLLYIIGSASEMFKGQDYVTILNERINTVGKLKSDGFEFNFTPKFWTRKLNIDETKNVINEPSDLYDSNIESVLGKNKNGDLIAHKTTSENLNYIYEDIMNKKVVNYNLFIVTSTFHILKTAIEIERHFYNSENNKPSNVIIIGNERFFELTNNKDKSNRKHTPLFYKKKIKSFLYEMFMFTLDKNSNK